MKKRTKRADARARKRIAKESGMARAGGESNYAKKKRWLTVHGGFGFNHPEKPWKSRD